MNNPCMVSSSHAKIYPYQALPESVASYTMLYLRNSSSPYPYHLLYQTILTLT